MTLREHIRTEERVQQGLEPEPAPVEAPVEATAPVVTPEEEVEHEATSAKPDQEVSQAARTLRKNRAAERKARIAAEIDDKLTERNQIRAELERERAELARLRAERTAAPAAAPTRAPAGTDPSDPEPDESTYAQYTDFVKDHTRWAAREELRVQQFQARARAEQRTATQAAEQVAETLTAQHTAARERFSDFDAVIDPVITRLRDTPRGADMGDFLAASEVGAEIVYRLGTDPAALEAVTTASTRVALLRELARTEAKILASKSAPKPVTKAPAPPSQTVGARANAAEVDTRVGVAFKDHVRIENARELEAKQQGRRY